jgi:hypothetical protein
MSQAFIIALSAIGRFGSVMHRLNVLRRTRLNEQTSPFPIAADSAADPARRGILDGGDESRTALDVPGAHDS